MIRAMRIRGFRSFDHESGVELKDLGRVNLFVGPNNVGKSNVGRFLGWVRDASTIAESRANRDTGAFFLEDLATAANRWMQEDQPFSAEIDLDPDVASIGNVAGDHLTGDVVRLQLKMWPERVWKASLLPGGGKEFSQEFGADTAAHAESGARARAGAGLAAILASAILEVRALRNATPSKPGSEPLVPGTLSVADGTDLIQRWEHFSRDQQRQPERRRALTRLQSWVGMLLGETGAVRVDTDQNEFYITRASGFRCPLKELGTGVSELVIVLASLLLLRHPEHRVVVLEEPEAHLHPGAAVAFVRLITREFPNVQLFIMSHSTTLIDAMDPDWRLFRVSMNGGGRTDILPLPFAEGEAATYKLALLASVGVRPSQLFLVNAAIFVEGPSDVVYLRRLLRDSPLIEGRDYGFIVYGGASGSYITLGPVDRAAQIDVLSFNLRPIILCDQDGGRDTPGRKWVVALSAAAKANGAGVVLDTPGREVENLLTPEALRDAAGHVVKQIGRRRVVFGLPAMPDGARFAEALAATIDPHLPGGGSKSIAKRLREGKVALAIHATSLPYEPFGPQATTLRTQLLEAIAGPSTKA